MKLLYSKEHSHVIIFFMLLVVYTFVTIFRRTSQLSSLESSQAGGQSVLECQIEFIVKCYG